jgi:hypothetical protein
LYGSNKAAGVSFDVFGEGWSQIGVEDYGVFCRGKDVREWAGGGVGRFDSGRRRGWGRGNKVLSDGGGGHSIW